jgi:hypothetical protein
MKKIFYLFAITAFIFTSCNPLEEINTEIDALTANDALVDDLVITLTDEDYKTLDLSFGNFSSNEDAKNMIPGFLTDMYPQLGVNYLPNGEINQSSSALVTYKLFSPISRQSYTVTPADYAAIGLSSLKTDSNVNAFFDYKFPSEAQGTVYTLTYLTDPILEEYTLTNDDYALVGNGRFNNFDIRAGRAEEDIEVRRSKIQTILLNNYPSAAFGVKYKVTYKVFDGAAKDLQMSVELKANPTNPAKTTNYTLVNADYALTGNGSFNNYDIRSGGPEEAIETRRGKIETVLLNNYPNAAIGDFFVVTYDTFAGGSDRPVLKMILQFDGTNYNIFDVKVYALYTFKLEPKTSKYALTTNWSAPITFSRAEYTLMGNSFPNFSGDANEAERKIGVYLKTLFPFAAPDDFKAVEYAFYNGSNTSARNTNFVYNGSVWNAIPTVINTSLKLGHNGTTWVPDNTIKYELTNADFALVDNGRYNNFDIRAGKAEETIEARLVKLNKILKNNFPNSEQGQKFSVTYATYDGTNGTRTTNVVLEGSDYILQ